MTGSATASLLYWYGQNRREMPWRGQTDPYRIWLSEVMLQQTRVDQATPYYLAFTSRFPDVASLAAADQHDVLMLWEGLGYYSRGRNLHKAAQTVTSQFGGIFPDTYDGLLSLPGIGPYTAAAIASICFNEPKAVVDGNVIRVIARYAGISDDVRKTETLREIRDIAQSLLDPSNPGDSNQALMELGALVCTPRNPKCPECPWQTSCVAYKTLQTTQIPYKTPAKPVPHHHIAVGIVDDGRGNVLIARRRDDAMLGGLWEFPGGKVEPGEKPEQAVIRELNEETGLNTAVLRPFITVKHAYSHFKITLHSFLCIRISGEASARESAEVRWIRPEELNNYPFPKANRKLTEALIGQK